MDSPTEHRRKIVLLARGDADHLRLDVRPDVMIWAGVSPCRSSFRHTERAIRSAEETPSPSGRLAAAMSKAPSGDSTRGPGARSSGVPTAIVDEDLLDDAQVTEWMRRRES